MSYFSSGSVRSGGLRAGVCPEAAASEANTLRQINALLFEMVEDLIADYVDSLLNRPFCIARRSIAGRLKPLPQFEILSMRSPNRRRGALPVIRKSEIVERQFGNKTVTQIFASAALARAAPQAVPRVGVDAGPGSPIPATTDHVSLLTDDPPSRRASEAGLRRGQAWEGPTALALAWDAALSMVQVVPLATVSASTWVWPSL